jgi:hypothetical protein
VGLEFWGVCVALWRVRVAGVETKCRKQKAESRNPDKNPKAFQHSIVNFLLSAFQISAFSQADFVPVNSQAAFRSANDLLRIAMFTG